MALDSFTLRLLKSIGRTTLGVLVVVSCAAWAGAQTGAPLPDYQRAVFDPIHFKPAIEQATNEQCLACHAEVLQPSVRPFSPAGVPATGAKAWYQLNSTYQGVQDTLHRRHLVTDYARQMMAMKCITCHEGHSARDEAPDTSASNQKNLLDLRKSVSASRTCLKCHGTMNHQVMGLPAPWPQVKDALQNNCLLCHATVRTNRHQVDYLRAEAIESAGAKSGDACYGCHGGRSWYRIAYPYPRNPWPGMPSEVPAWAKGRATQSEIRFLSNLVKPGPAR